MFYIESIFVKYYYTTDSQLFWVYQPIFMFGCSPLEEERIVKQPYWNQAFAIDDVINIE